MHEVTVTQKELRDEVDGDLSRSGLANAKKALIEDHKKIEELEPGIYVPENRELF